MAGEIERALYAHLVGWEYLTTLTGDRVYPLVIPESETLPALAYQRISGRRILAHGGPSGLAEARIQITIVSADYADAKEIAGAVRDLFDGWRGVLGEACEVYSCRIENEIDGWANQTETATVRLDLFFLYRE